MVEIHAASSVKFNFSYAGTAASDTTCFYFDVRKASTGAVLGTHGSAASPVGCTTGTALKATETAIPEVTSNEVAGDLQVRIYVSSSGPGQRRPGDRLGHQGGAAVHAL